MPEYYLKVANMCEKVFNMLPQKQPQAKHMQNISVKRKDVGLIYFFLYTC